MNNTNDKLSLQMGRVYGEAFGGIIPIILKVMLLAVCFYLPYILVRILIDPSFSGGMQPLGFEQAIVTYNETQQVSELINSLAALDKRAVAAEIFRFILVGLFLFNVFYLCVQVSQKKAVDMKAFFTLDYQKKFLANCVAKLLFGLLGFAIGVLVFGVGMLMFLAGTFGAGVLSAFPYSMVFIVIAALLGIVVLCTLVAVFIVAVCTLEAYSRIVSVCIINGEVSFAESFFASWKLMEGNRIKIGAFALLNIVGLFCFGAMCSAWILPLKMLFTSLDLPFWIFQLISQAPVVIVANIFVYLFYAAVFKQLKELAAVKNKPEEKEDISEHYESNDTNTTL